MYYPQIKLKTGHNMFDKYMFITNFQHAESILLRLKYIESYSNYVQIN